MSLLSKVVAATGATRADIVRVATEGGTSAADWDIAHAIEAAGGRRAADLMGRDKRHRLQKALYGPATSAEDRTLLEEAADRRGIPADMLYAETGDIAAEAPAQTNPRAKRDKTAVIYTEDPGGVLTDVSEQADATRYPDKADIDASEAAELAEEVWLPLTRYARSVRVANRIIVRVASAPTKEAARHTLYWALAKHPRTNLFSLHPTPELATAA